MTGVGGPSEPAIDGVPGDSLDTSNRRLAQAFDAEGGNLVEGGAAMLQPMVRCPSVRAELWAGPRDRPQDAELRGTRREKPIRRPKLDPFTGVIDQILFSDEALPKKQRYTAQRIYERLQDEHGFSGGYTIVKGYVRLKRTSQHEMFVPLTHAPGNAQADFGEAQVEIGGVLAKAYYFVIDLQHSDESYLRAFPAETTEAFLEGHVEAFRYWAGVPRRILYDNTTLAVTRILGDGTRMRPRPSRTCSRRQAA